MSIPPPSCPPPIGYVWSVEYEPDALPETWGYDDKADRHGPCPHGAYVLAW